MNDLVDLAKRKAAQVDGTFFHKEEMRWNAKDGAKILEQFRANKGRAAFKGANVLYAYAGPFRQLLLRKRALLSVFPQICPKNLFYVHRRNYKPNL